jgi:hypothetical protein
MSTAESRKPIVKWNQQDVLNWLDRVNLAMLRTCFQTHEITGDMLLGLTNEDFEVEMEVTSGILRKRLLKEVDALRQLALTQGVILSCFVLFCCVWYWIELILLSCSQMLRAKLTKFMIFRVIITACNTKKNFQFRFVLTFSFFILSQETSLDFLCNRLGVWCNFMSCSAPRAATTSPSRSNQLSPSPLSDSPLQQDQMLGPVLLSQAFVELFNNNMQSVETLLRALMGLSEQYRGQVKLLLHNLKRIDPPCFMRLTSFLFPSMSIPQPSGTSTVRLDDLFFLLLSLYLSLSLLIVYSTLSVHFHVVTSDLFLLVAHTTDKHQHMIQFVILQDIATLPGDIVIESILRKLDPNPQDHTSTDPSQVCVVFLLLLLQLWLYGKYPDLLCGLKCSQALHRFLFRIYHGIQEGARVLPQQAISCELFVVNVLRTLCPNLLFWKFAERLRVYLSPLRR